MVTRNVLEQVLRRGTYDTWKYRYHLCEAGEVGHVRRIDINYLGTTAALDWENWKLVAVIPA